MSARNSLDISAYFVVGPENTRGRAAASVIRDVVEAGFTCIQIRSKTASALELIELTREAADVIRAAGRGDKVTLVVNDRLDVVIAARKMGVKVDGIHVGQTDIPAAICRECLGEDAIVGLSAETREVFDYIASADVRGIDYFGAGPLRETPSKTDLAVDGEGKTITRTFAEIARLAKLSPIPVVVGGGVKLADIPQLAATGIGGFFVVSAISEAENPREEAMKMREAWMANLPGG